MSRNDYQKMAGAFMDMWQEQLTKSLTDKDMVRQMMQFMQGVQPGNWGKYEQKDRHTTDASRARDDELADLRRRVAACERRIKQLESHIESLEAKTKPKTVKKPKKQSKNTKTTSKQSASASKRNGSAAKTGKTAKSTARKPKAKPVKRAVRRSK